ncbi:SpoIIE family protein phosphatase [Streptomyces litchfieldiae]|uniref:SpoIIE family protein phosphatase n=1 Tax=Streptomyces litchfieldiae TaxID=3075543 RepID=A0ABU2MMQ2_9ACTN|nr:SpoIIE family protein phosphatase [Streptomyces sp. DSM 44938]MDT0341934.1 SpoIIE family protein phosphatase [Streptomyces sp. DSM 44938]
MGDLSPTGLERLDPPLVRALRETGAYGGGIYLLAERERILRLAVTSGLPTETLKPWLRVDLDAPMPLPDALREDRLIWLPVGEMARRYPQAGVVVPYPFAACYTPITEGGRRWGVLSLVWSGDHPADLNTSEKVAVDVGCRGLAQVLRRAEQAGRPLRVGDRPHVAVRPRGRTPDPAEAQAAAEFAERLPEGCCALDLEGRITFANATAAKLVGAEPARLLGARPWEVLSWLSDPVFEDRYRSALFSRQPGSFTALRPPDRWLRFQLYPDVFGISVRITTATSAPGARALSSARSAPTRAGALYHLMQLATVLTEAAGVQDVVDLVAGQIMPALDAQGLMLFGAEAGRLQILGSRGYPDRVREHFDHQPMSPATSPAARVLADGVPAFYPSPEDMERDYPGLPELTGKSAWALLPLIASGRTVGCCVLSYAKPKAFTADERTVLSSLAGLIAQALERARLYDTKHDLARRLQAGLLPHELPDVPGLKVAARYLPATHGIEIGGDFYDLIQLGDEDENDAVAAAIGDVQGHNVTAAALMGQVRTAVHATAGAPPAEVLARANRLLTDLDPGLFTSCLYAHLDLAAHRARLATAGHLPPLVRQPDGQVTRVRLAPGTLLGIDPSADYSALEVALPPGAVLLLYTDGLIERPGVDLDDSIAELAEHLADAGDQPIDELADSLLRHAGQQNSRSDDIALLLLSPT